MHRRYFEGRERFRSSTSSDKRIEPSPGAAAEVLVESFSDVTSTGAFSVEPRNGGIADATGVTSAGNADCSLMTTPGSRRESHFSA